MENADNYLILKMYMYTLIKYTVISNYSFHMKLETHYSPSFHQELVGAASMMESWYNNLTNFQAEGPIILNTEDVDGGTVATVIQELFSFDNPVKVRLWAEPIGRSLHPCIHYMYKRISRL